MKLKFSKMQGLGNDFVVIDAVRQCVELSPARVRALADRHFGIGCDQVLVVEAAPAADVDFRYRIFNADGGEVEQCGNGARCFVRFVHEERLSDRRALRVQTQSGIIVPRLEDDGQVTVDMGVPV
ncbi:MAG: diaminopimelate epimerase, partial [Rhodocyclaceae bacterium]|nr:diaminopimelate epimerase [Rhodocyclaceae bacterium]